MGRIRITITEAKRASAKKTQLIASATTSTLFCLLASLAINRISFLIKRDTPLATAMYPQRYKRDKGSSEIKIKVECTSFKTSRQESLKR